jgi:hypothetical protein
MLGLPAYSRSTSSKEKQQPETEGEGLLQAI